MCVFAARIGSIDIREPTTTLQILNLNKYPTLILTFFVCLTRISGSKKVYLLLSAYLISTSLDVI